MRDMELAAAQASVDAMEEGAGRQLAQARLDFERRKEEQNFVKTAP